MTTDFRALGAKIVELWDADCDIHVEINELRELLATPPPEPLRPIPVSERLPEAGDCDTDGSCWVHQPDESWPESPEWKLMRNKYISTIYRSTHWLPYNAIPFPEVTQ